MLISDHIITNLKLRDILDYSLHVSYIRPRNENEIYRITQEIGRFWRLIKFSQGMLINNANAEIKVFCVKCNSYSGIPPI